MWRSFKKFAVILQYVEPGNRIAAEHKMFAAAM